MKTPKIMFATKNIVIGILTTMMILSFTSCTKKIVFLKSSVVPAAEGYVKVKTDKNNNYTIQLNLSNLAGVDRLQPNLKTYVVWMLTEEEMPENIGRISTTNKLNATFETVSSYKPVKIFITAEENERVQIPGKMVVLTTDIFWK